MKIAVISSHTQSLFLFRMDMMKSFIDEGHTVVAFGSEDENIWSSKFEENGIIYKKFFVQRNGLNPFGDLKTLIELSRLIKNEKPDKIFLYQAKTIIYGSVAAKINGVNEVYSLVAGLGSILRGKGIKNKTLRIIMRYQYKIACAISAKVIFQNIDDADEFVKQKMVNRDKVVIINGSGVNLDKFVPAPLPSTPTFLFIGRLIKDKGIVEYLEASKKIKQHYPEIKCLLVGPYDTNPSALKKEELLPYIESEIIDYFGEQNDVIPFINQCSTFVLPSYHEGTPKAVLEAMAVGRSIITTNAPGCKETVVDGFNGYLVPVNSVDSLVEKMTNLIKHPNLNISMAEHSLSIVREKYDVKKVNQSIMRIMELV